MLLVVVVLVVPYNQIFSRIADTAITLLLLGSFGSLSFRVGFALARMLGSYCGASCGIHCGARVAAIGAGCVLSDSIVLYYLR